MTQQPEMYKKLEQEFRNRALDFAVEYKIPQAKLLAALGSTRYIKLIDPRKKLSLRDVHEICLALGANIYLGLEK